MAWLRISIPSEHRNVISSKAVSVQGAHNTSRDDSIINSLPSEQICYTMHIRVARVLWQKRRKLLHSAFEEIPLLRLPGNTLQ
jgi:hypothetical protein